jgi:hypothetical protein
MHDPNTLAFRFKIPFEVEIWHVDPCKNGDDDSAGWSQPKLSNRQRENALAVSHGWKTWMPIPSYDFAWSGVELIWSVWGDVKYREHKSRAISSEEMAVIWNLAANPVDNLRASAIKAMHGNDDHIEHFVRLIYRCFLAHHRPWYRHPRWNFTRWRVEIRALGIKFGRKAGDVEMDW